MKNIPVSSIKLRFCKIILLKCYAVELYSSSNPFLNRLQSNISCIVSYIRSLYIKKVCSFKIDPEVIDRLIVDTIQYHEISIFIFKYTRLKISLRRTQHFLNNYIF